MEKIIRAYRFRLYPNEDQKVLLSKHFGSIRFVFNYFLNYKDTQFKEQSTTLSRFDLQKILTQMKKEKQYSWMKEINSQSLQGALINLDNAYSRFFKKIAKFPRFKSKKSRQSFSIPQNIKVNNNLVFIPKFKEGLKFKKSREIKGRILSAIISKVPSGKYFISFCVEQNNLENKQKTNKEIGIDLGLKHYLILSNGQKVDNPKYLKQYQKKLKKLQRIFNRKTKDSHRKEKFRLKVARLHEKITNSREDFQNKLTTKLLDNYDLICLETLAVKNMMSNHKLASSIGDAGWYSFTSKLMYKAKWRNKQIVQIDRFYPSSKTCSVCNFKMQDMKLNVREWDCPKCGTHHDRDVNAAKNILAFGKALIADSLGSNEYSHGGAVRLKKSPHKKTLQSGSDEVMTKLSNENGNHLQ